VGREVRSAVLSGSVADGDQSTYRRAVGAAFAAPTTGARLAALEGLYAGDVAWHGPHPIDDCAGREAVLARFWRPLFAAFPDLERREDICIAGSWQGTGWIGATGHYAGTFAADWLGIRATRGYASIRYGEFVRLSGGQVREAYVILDLLDLMRQAGAWPLAPPLGNADRVPGPMTRDGVRSEAGDAAESAKSLALVEAMIAGLMRYDGRSLDSMEQWLYWHRDFTWYGPAGIGTCRGQADYRRVHQGPFLAAFPDRVGGDHKCRIADGTYVGSTGWPSIRATHLGGGFLGLPPTRRRITMRVMDFWRRDGELLRENWVFIDLLDLLAQMGLDVMARMRTSGALAGDAGPARE
jgi:predicted ester cyclase